ncbi:lectin-like domain-containing protein, partial [Leuconostoc suionicum]|uniref:lectin-like domain-containing protein n=1 Tax=Leuconostoc suionicum TaxID=1511761 RepID=UPI00403748F8
MWEKKTIRTRIQRYKLYKSGKTWITALIFAVALSVPINSVVYSDSTATTASNYNNSSTTNINNSNFLDFFSIINNDYTKYDANSGILKLTTGSQQAGGVTFKNDIDLSKPFSMDFDINVGSGNVADGIGIAFYSGDRNQIGKKAGNLGIYGIPNAFGWKLDTWNNPESDKNLLYGQNDKGLTNPYAAFVTTDNSGYGTIDQSSDNTYKALPSTIKDGQFHHVSVQYDGNMNITITLNYNKDYTFTKNLNGIVPINQPLHLNIASSTGGYATTHQVRFNSMSYYQSSTPPTVNKIYDSDSSISGTGVAGSNINIYDDNGKFIGSTIVSDDGTWIFTIDNNLLKEGANYKVTQKSPNQGESITTSSKVLHDPNIDDQKTAQKKSLQEEHDKIVNDI